MNAGTIHPLRAALALAGVVVLSACTGLNASTKPFSMPSEPEAKAASSVMSVPGPYIAVNPVPYVAPGHAVSLDAQGVPIGVIERRLAHRIGYDVAFAEGAKPDELVYIRLGNVGRREAIERVAFAAGYAAVVDRDSRQVTLAKRATYFYRIPQDVFKNLSAGASFVVNNSGSAGSGGQTGMSGSSSGSGGGATAYPGSTPSGGSAGGMGGSPGGMSSGSGGSGANFTVTGHVEPDTAQSFERSVRTVAGSGAVVGYNMGLLSVTADAGGLNRVTWFVRHFVRDAETRVAIHAVIMEVSLEHGLQWGINWQHVLENTALSVTGTAPALSGTLSAATGGGQVTYTSANIKSVVTALRAITSVKVLTEPSLLAQNDSPATLFSGKQVPYVGSIQSSVSGLSGSSTTGTSLSYASDGLSLSIMPDVLSTDRVAIEFIPSIQRIDGFQQFNVSGNELSGPVQEIRQAYIKVITKSGQTLIVGGAKESARDRSRQGVPGVMSVPGLGILGEGIANQSTATQLVFLVRARVLPAPRYNVVAGSAL
ncbi:MAG: type II secretion system protein GspD [Acidiferrobacterales bacterium]